MNEEKPMTPEQQKALEALQALHDENERLGFYKDAYAQSTTTQTQVLRTEDTLKLALKAMESFQSGTNGLYEGEFQEEINAIKEALQSNEQELDYKAIGQQAYESGYSTGYMDCAVKMKAQSEHVWTPERIAGIARLKEAQDKKLAQQEHLEPVAWIDDYNACKCPDNEARCFSDKVFRMMQKHTPQRKEPEQEPVAKVCHDLDGHIGWNPKLTQLPDEGTPLYTSSPQRTWAGLTPEEIDEIEKETWDEDHKSWGIHDFAEAIEAKLKEKNT